MTYGLSDKTLTAMLQAFKNYDELVSVVLFGSRAMGNYRNGSDIDLALLGNVSQATRDSLSTQLNEVLPLPYFFDIVIYAKLSNKTLKEHIDDKGVVIYQRAV